MPFLQRLYGLIAAAGITNNKLLTDLGINKSAIFSWETRGTIPSGEIIAKLADYFHVSTDYLLGRTDDPRPVGELGGPAPIVENGPPGYNTLSPSKKAAVDQMVAALKEDQPSNVTPIKISAVALGGGEYDTEADTVITLPEGNSKVRPAQDTAETGDEASAPKEK